MPKKGKNPELVSLGDTDSDASFITTDNVLLLIEKITTNFTTSFNNCVDKIVDAVERKLGQRIDLQASEIFELHKKIECLEKNNKQLETTNNQLSDKCNQLNAKLE